nr:MULTISPECIES: hypothetical protein [unclassified Rhodococcus (in: high G+C Gram-positive bacteria)]
MDESLLVSIFMRELRTQARTARGAALRLGDLRERVLAIELRGAEAVDDEARYFDDLKHQDADDALADECFRTVQAILTAAALASKCLWSPRRTTASRRRNTRLRELLAIAENEQGFPRLLRSRAVRNAFEHFDERVEDYLEHSNFLVDRCVGSRDWAACIRSMRLVNVTTWEVSVLDTAVDLQALLQEMEELSLRATTWLNGHFVSSRPLTP